MKTNFIYAGLLAFDMIITIVLFIIVLRKNRYYENKNKTTPGRLGDNDIPGRYLDIQRSEQPFISMRDINN